MSSLEGKRNSTFASSFCQSNINLAFDCLLICCCCCCCSFEAFQAWRAAAPRLLPRCVSVTTVENISHAAFLFQSAGHRARPKTAIQKPLSFFFHRVCFGHYGGKVLTSFTIQNGRRSTWRPSKAFVLVFFKQSFLK